MKLPRAITITQSLRYVGLLVAVVAALVAIYLWQQQIKLEPAIRYKCDLPAFALVDGKCLEQVPVPVNRKFDVVTKRADIEGLWVIHPIAVGELAHPSQLTRTPPDRFRFSASGVPLPVGTWGFFLPVTGAILEVAKPGNLLTLALADGKTQQLIIVFDKAEILNQGGGGIYAGLTMDQIAAVEKLKQEMLAATTDDKQTPKAPPQLTELVWTVTQGANPSLPTLGVFRMELSAQALMGKKN